MLFWDDIMVKSLKTIYNNKELASKIEQYIIEHIQSLDKILMDLKQAGVIITGAKSLFCWAGLNIMKFICDINSCQLNISQVLKI